MRLYKVFSLLEFLIFLFFIVLALSLLFFYFNNSSLNNKGVKALKSRDFLRAKKYFSQNVESGFSDHRSYLNLALSYDLLKQPLKALEIYNIVSSSNNRSKDVFFSYFNQAELYGRMEKLEKALKNYQSALEFRQKEKEIKTNIELLFKQKNQKEQKENKPADSKNSENQKQSNRLNDSQSKKDKNKNQSSGDKSQSGESSVKNQEKEDQKQGGEEEQNKSKDGHSEENKDKGQSEKNDSPSEGNQNKGSDNQLGDTAQNKQKALTDREQEAILEEVQKQENKVRTRFYQNKRSFGDKTGKDW